MKLTRRRMNKVITAGMTIGGALTDKLLFAQQAQQTRSNLAPVRVGGVYVVSVKGNALTTINNLSESEQLLLDSTLTVWKGVTYSGTAAVQALQPGDEIKVRGRLDPVTGQFIATEIFDNWRFLSGTITSVPVGSAFEVQPSRSGAAKQITYTANTEFVFSAPSDMQNGSSVDVVGLALANGAIQSTRITVFDTKGRPTRLPSNSKVILPNGSTSTLR